ncbi:MAG: nucleotidyl transferase AbiEii/AbiGii toxin family protein [Deltaproteobacteria bacterium]|nr:nucleotidyl transferase AbiEii/AbiGii toxin family protein [Deltaproteobacteria bacterium]
MVFSEILTPLQKRLLEIFTEYPIFKDFYFTGGTALSAIYLQHRFSEDLDFFTEVPQGVARIIPIIEEIAKKVGLQIVMGRRFETLFECTLAKGSEEKVEFDFALDLPGRLQPVRLEPSLRLYVDNELDIACNKLSALYDRAEPKDFVDLYFLVQEKMSFETLLANARKKFPGIDDYGLSLTFFKVKGVEKLPRMIKPLKIQTLKEYFLDKAAQMSNQI